MTAEWPILVSALEHWSYCPRQCGLIHVESVWDENVFTLRGSAVHSRADRPTARSERGLKVERALPIWSARLGLTGRADVVEFCSDGAICPVEYKSGPVVGGKHAEVQLCAQALCLEEMFRRPVPAGAIYFVKPKKRIPVAIDVPLRSRTLEYIEAIRRMVETGHLPPAVYDRRCRACSLLDACLPQMLEGASRHHPEAFRPLPEREIP